jgi:PTH1 family peptidyl-tRNA hydrolase
LRVIFGIGNPGGRYERNRHNAGFLFLDFYAAKNSLEFLPSKGDYFKAAGSIADSQFVLIKPTTYVNNSGFAAKQIVDENKIQSEDFLTICDDTNLNTGTLRLRLSGGDGGHNGLASVIYNLNSNNFPRIRIGVGKGLTKGSLADYVLSDFNDEEIQILNGAFEKILLLVNEFIVGGSKAMLDLNSSLNKTENGNNKIS